MAHIFKSNSEMGHTCSKCKKILLLGDEIVEFDHVKKIYCGLCYPLVLEDDPKKGK